MTPDQVKQIVDAINHLSTQICFSFVALIIVNGLNSFKR